MPLRQLMCQFTKNKKDNLKMAFVVKIVVQTKSLQSEGFIID
jgi:hypothetical protein